MIEQREALRYKGYTATCQEVPNEVSVVFNICGCPIRCEDCHSKYLWENDGELLLNDFQNIITQYSDLATCVCFMGGDQNIIELSLLCGIAREYGYKTCLYTGNRLSDELRSFALANLDYLKVGEFISECGGLDNPNTNQRMYYIDGEMTDITHLFRAESD